jgi:DNA invertase Pin-like site-specific DNA recombinase
MKALRAALYVRVSTLNHGQTTANQRLELEAYCQRQGWTVVEVYDDTGVSGSKADRPALDKMLKDASAHKFDVVVCWKVDRMARSTMHLLQLLQTLQSFSIGYVAATQNLDTTTAAGKMVTVFLSAVAEFELALTRERIVAGQNRARAEGTHIGRKRVGFDVAKALELRGQGLGYLQIARQLGVPRSTLHRTLAAIPKVPAA